MVTEMVNAGLRVGVTANSHKVIGSLLALRGHDTNSPYQSACPVCGLRPRLPGWTVRPSFISTIAMNSATGRKYYAMCIMSRNPL